MLDSSNYISAGIHQVLMFSKKIYAQKYYQKNKKKLDKINKKYNKNHKKQINNTIRKRWAIIRQKILEEVGNSKCKKCGVEDIRVLQLDHINGNGNILAKQITSGSMRHYYYYNNLELAKKELQVLCANCHMIKTIEHGDFK